MTSQSNRSTDESAPKPDLMSLFDPPPTAPVNNPTEPEEKETPLPGSLADLFQPPTDDAVERSEDRQTLVHSNNMAFAQLLWKNNQARDGGDEDISGSLRQLPSEQSPLLRSSPNVDYQKGSSSSKTENLQKTQPHGNNDNDDDDITPKTSSVTRKQHRSTKSSLPSIYEIPIGHHHHQQHNHVHPPKHRVFSLVEFRDQMASFVWEFTKPKTWVGSFMFVLFQLVFSLTMGAAITRPHATTSMLGLYTKMAALGIMLGGPIYCFTLGSEIPALYPTVDLFSAPFLANIAAVVDGAIASDPDITSDEDVDGIFLATFCTLTSISLFLSGTLLIASSVFKLANLGAYLPFPVLAGFFAAVGVLTWTLSFKIDANGKSVGDVFGSGDWDLIQTSCLHHLPSVVVAAIMKYLGPKNPLYVVGVVFATIGTFYTVMFVFNLSREEMIEQNWFWSADELIYQGNTASMGFDQVDPPAPFGWINDLGKGRVLWSAVQKALDPTLALSFLYLIRCSLHGAAMKKNVSNLQRKVKRTATQATRAPMPSKARHHRAFSEAVDLEHASTVRMSAVDDDVKVEKAKAPNVGLQDINIQYGYSQYICALVGSFAVTPSVAAASTMFELGADQVAPQIGNLFLLFGFYISNFKLVSYIPKPAFSALLVLAFIDMMWTWFVKSYFKTKNKSEWFVIPLIVIFAFVVGLLQSVFLGLAMSTFLFVASFFRSGVVKYVANGVTVRSTIERVMKDATWLDLHGDLVQILVLQNYLFFGNASSILSYIASMFEDPDPAVDPVLVSPEPQVIVLDLTLVTGMDTSAVDVFADILNLCGSHECKLFLAGVSHELRAVMQQGGFRPETTHNRSKRKLRFFSTLDGAVGKAEDMLLDQRLEDSFESRDDYSKERGFLQTLNLIDEQHGTCSAEHLADLEPFVQFVEVEPGDVLYEKHLLGRGLFFIEEGIMRIEMSSDLTTTRAGSTTLSRQFRSINKGSEHFSSMDQGIQERAKAWFRAGDKALANAGRFRIARVGPGWVLGSTECLAGVVNPASTIAVTPCSLYFLSFQQIDEIEKERPLLALRLYKLLSSLLAKRQELTISQLSTLHSIMSAHPQKHPTGRGSRIPRVASFFH